MIEYSVLMSVYIKEKAENLEESVLSMLNQSVRPSDFVIICDGPLTKDLDDYIDQVSIKHPDLFQVIRLQENQGLGNALKIGIEKCKFDIIARMDSDDIALPKRCEVQLDAMIKHNADIVSASVSEFDSQTGEIYATKRVPETHEEVLKYVKRGNPFNHPCTVLRRSAVQHAGGYQPFYLLEDYFLWIRMLSNGAIGYNVPDTLLQMRAGRHMYERRGGWQYFLSNIKLQKELLQRRMIGPLRYFINICKRFVSQVLLPGRVRSFAYVVKRRLPI